MVKLVNVSGALFVVIVIASLFALVACGYIFDGPVPPVERLTAIIGFAQGISVVVFLLGIVGIGVTAHASYDRKEP